MKGKNINPYDSICKIFNNEELFINKNKNCKTVLILYVYV